MPYVPQNLTVYETAMAGAMAALAASPGSPADGASADYVPTGNVAETWAEALDTAWGAVVPNTYQVFAIKESSYSVFLKMGAPSGAAALAVGTYTVTAAAVKAAVLAGSTVLTGKGVTPDAWPGGGGGATTPLDRCKYIASGTSVPAASQNGFIGLPFATIRAAIAAVGIGTSVADNTQNMVYKIQPAKGAINFGLATYPETITGTPYRNEELDGDSETVLIDGQYNLANSAAAVTAAGGNPANKPSVNIRAWRNILFLQNVTITDDGTLTTEFFFSGSATAFCGFQGAFDTSACTAVAVVAANNWTFVNGYTGTSAASGANFACQQCAIGGAVTAKVVNWQVVNYSGTNITVASGSGSTFIQCLFTGANPTITGAGGVASAVFDLDSWNSFLAAGGTLVNMTVVVQGVGRSMGQTPLMLAAGGTATLVADGAGDNSVNNPGNLVLCDMTAAACTVNATTLAQVGDVFGVGNQGVGATPAKVNATNSLGGTTVIEDPGNPGNFSGANGQVAVTGQGQVTWWKLIPGGKWKIVASA